MNKINNSAQENPIEGQEEQKRDAFSTFRVIQTIVLLSAVLATLLTLWNPYKLFSQKEFIQPGQDASADSSTTATNTIGILVGHWKVDSGAVCENGIVEANVNEAIANQVSVKLSAMGYSVKLLAETDIDLINFRGPTLIAIYCKACDEESGSTSGFSIGTTLKTSDMNAANTLAACMGEIYQKSTNLDFAYQIINSDHRAYPIFEVVNPKTPMIYLEMGSLFYDQAVLIDDSEKVANGIVNGILCYLDTLEEQP